MNSTTTIKTTDSSDHSESLTHPGNNCWRIRWIIKMAVAFLCWSAAALFNLYPARKAGISIRLIRRPLMRECGCLQNNQINQLFNKISCSGCLKQRAFQSVQSAGPYCPSADALRIVRTFSCFKKKSVVQVV